MKKFLPWLVAVLLSASPVLADSQGSATGGTAGTQSTGAGCINQTPSLTSGQQATLSCDATGHLKMAVTPGPLTIVALDVSTVTTGGTAVTALIAGHRSAGGFLTNPKGATIDLCINEQAAASGTTSAAGLTCISPGQAYTLAPSALAVSVITSDSAHPFSGYGLN